jgi:hypothetical protein
MEEGQQVLWDSVWKQLPLFPGYWVNQYGQVWNMRRRALMSLYRNQHGVLSVRVYGRLTAEGSRGYTRSVEKLVRELHGTELVDPSRLW